VCAAAWGGRRIRAPPAALTNDGNKLRGIAAACGSAVAPPDHGAIARGGGGDGGSTATYFPLYLSYSANFADQAPPNPPGSGYHWSLQQSRLQLSAAFAQRLAAARDGGGA